MKETDIVHDAGAAWVLADPSKGQYTVFRTGVTHSTSDSAYAMNPDGLSIAKARADWIAKRAGGAP